MKREGIAGEALLLCVLFGYLAVFGTGQPAWMRALHGVASAIWAFTTGRRANRDWHAVRGEDEK